MQNELVSICMYMRVCAQNKAQADMHAAQKNKTKTNDLQTN